MATIAARFDGVSKSYPTRWPRRGVIRAVSELSMSLDRGEVLGVIGPNRAGKSTLAKLVLSLCRPTRGRVERLGRPASDRRTLARVGYVHEEAAFPTYLTATGLLHEYGALTGVGTLARRHRIPRLLERVGLADRASEPIARFSKGMGRRLALAQALLNEPELLVLDEPFAGMDLDGRRLVEAAVRERRDVGAAVLLISHDLDEVERLCDRVAVMSRGQLRRDVSGAEDAGPPREDWNEALEDAFRSAEPVEACR